MSRFAAFVFAIVEAEYVKLFAVSSTLYCKVTRDQKAASTIPEAAVMPNISGSVVFHNHFSLESAEEEHEISDRDDDPDAPPDQPDEKAVVSGFRVVNCQVVLRVERGQDDR